MNLPLSSRGAAARFRGTDDGGSLVAPRACSFGAPRLGSERPTALPHLQQCDWLATDLEDKECSAADTVDSCCDKHAPPIAKVGARTSVGAAVPAVQTGDTSLKHRTPPHNMKRNGTLGKLKASKSGTRFQKKLTKVAVFEHQRDMIRAALLAAAGTRAAAFRHLDNNGSGTVSLQEFTDGLRNLRIDWQKLTGLRTGRELMALFDSSKRGAFSAAELFPEEQQSTLGQRERMDTPEFWNHWCRQNAEEDEGDTTPRVPKWQPGNLDKMMQLHEEANGVRELLKRRRQWISKHYRLLRNDGQTNGKCRDWIAHHLLGANTKARDMVKVYTKNDVGANRQAYQEQVLEPVRNIGSSVNAMREQRRELASSRKQLWSAVLEPLVRHEEEQDVKSPFASLNKFGGLARFEDPGEGLGTSRLSARVSG
eukprot:TRINITY_DN42348_c0_g1_i1.p1 TRINITY_DN42348_c0_g1~~TRINITY_DN42348_c0_g1_i1.p1  ORF type:complete len:424 (-),score=85.15 TRINITY_DN42348_c0_g1_i1:103-1374(-)